MIAAIPNCLQHEVLAARCVLQRVPSALLFHLGRLPDSSERVTDESHAARSDVAQVLEGPPLF